MAPNEEVLEQLVAMSNRLGEEQRGLIILGEGNTSAKAGDDTFYVKASGTQLSTITAEGFVEVRSSKVLDMFESSDLTDEDIKDWLRAAVVDADCSVMPSIETLFHGYLLTLPGVRFVAHTHPISVNSILCSKGWYDVTQGRLFPDEIVCCGTSPAYVEYTDPGVPLARRIREVVTDYIKENGERPKAILMQNHGLIALGSSPREVESITLMWDKTAKVLAGTFHFGGPNYLSRMQVERIRTRPDEERRKKIIEG